jgi:1,4-dihydroxy-2-naphthoate octaprenyltransferase
MTDITGSSSTATRAAPAVSLLEAATTLPRVEADRWARTGPAARWLLLSRAPVLTMTMGAWGCGVLLAALAGSHAWLVAGLCGLGLLLAHATNNQLNDLTDHLRGIDRGNSYRARYGVHVLEQGLMSPRALWHWALGTGLVALAVGLSVVALAGAVVWLPLLAGALLLVAYTHPLKTLGLGELAVLLVWGPLMVGGTHAAMTGGWDAAVVATSVVAGLAPTLVIFGKHIDKRAMDAARGVGTLPVRMGDAPARTLMRSLLLLQFALHATLCAGGWLPWPTLLAFAALPAAWRLQKVVAAPAPTTPPEGYPAAAWPLWFAAHAFVYTRLHGALLALGLLFALALP